MGNEVEWRIKARDGSSVEILVLAERFGRIKQWIEGLGLKLVKFLKKAWELGVKDPKKFIHGIKVATALTLVSLFYYVKPLYDGVEGNAMWAVMTVVVVFQYTAGETISKTINRICATSIAGLLAIGVHWAASRAGDHVEPIIVNVSLFLLASATTFSRFIPTIKARFDYGAVIFILTFSLVSISGYRVDELFRMTLERILTIVIGTCFCIITSITIRPVWAGQELHLSITTNMDKLANSLDVCVVQYFNDQTSSVSDDESDKKSLGYKCVLSSKATEDSMAKFARWEPAHGRFRFRHPWKQYLKVGTSMRTCAACIDALVGCVNIENKDHHIDHMKEQISGMSLRLSANCASVIRELAKTSRNMTKSSKVDILVGEINSATQELQQVLKSNSITNVTKTQGLSPQLVLTETFQLLALASLLIEIAARVEDIVKDVQQLADWLISCLQTLSNLSIINPKILKIHAP
ncbi:aluminum-activated malate transporter 10 isoform X2 [Prosopis cineraria]|uniref:aluminum-activated malate transporter 10 isoform X2 n=1 Tax=Prosopis cineraria TaxID=364024 RepID=UPI00240F770D|nr:aluminum-activated malate transporter 10 isoform X2 [Prosopis cineraria]